MHVAPLQLGHAQTVQPQSAAVDITFESMTAQQPLAETSGVLLATAVEQPQVPQVQTSHWHDVPLQSGHWQSVQPQDDLASISTEVCPAGASTYREPITTARSGANNTEKVFMIEVLLRVIEN